MFAQKGQAYAREKNSIIFAVQDADVCNRSEIRRRSLRKHLAQIRSGFESLDVGFRAKVAV